MPDKEYEGLFKGCSGKEPIDILGTLFIYSLLIGIIMSFFK